MTNPAAPLRAISGFVRMRQERRNLHAVYDKYAAFTMISRLDYVLNLQLAGTVSAVDGAVVECGVWRGGMIAGIAEVLGGSREYVLCDSFQGLPEAQSIDGHAALQWQSDTDGPTYHDNCIAAEREARAAMALSPARRVQVVAGWFEKTLPTVRVDGGIALLRLDGDWYESTMACLDALYDRVVPGGLVIIDDYYTWDGCARAVHDFLSRRGVSARIQQWANAICYLRAPEQTPHEASVDTAPAANSRQ
jgi:O-methyltransferase